MRRVRYSVAMSLDGYIAGPQGEFDWIPRDPAMDWKAFMARFDTVLIGRKTYEMVAAQGSGTVSGMRTFVFSQSLRPSDHPQVTVIGKDAASVVRDLKAREGRDIWLMGGGVLFRSLLEADVVDAVEVGLVPVLLGRGVPLLPPTSRSTSLRLSETRGLPTGIVRLSYTIDRKAIKRKAR